MCVCLHLILVLIQHRTPFDSWKSAWPITCKLGALSQSQLSSVQRPATQRALCSWKSEYSAQKESHTPKHKYNRRKSNRTDSVCSAVQGRQADIVCVVDSVYFSDEATLTETLNSPNRSSFSLHISFSRSQCMASFSPSSLKLPQSCLSEVKWSEGKRGRLI